MASTYPWNTFTDRGNLASTMLDSLANATLSAVSTALDNATNKDTHCFVEINLGSLTPVTPGYLELYMIKAPDGTLYEDAPVIGGLDVNTLVDIIPVKAGAAAKRVISIMFVLPPFPVKFYVGNQLNVTTAASSNTLDVYTGILAST